MSTYKEERHSWVICLQLSRSNPTFPEKLKERQLVSLPLSCCCCCCCCAETFPACTIHHTVLGLCGEKMAGDGMTEEEDGWKKCCGCTSLRSGTLIVGAFDIAVSSIAIVVSVAALVNTQVPFVFIQIYERFIEGQSWA